MTRNRFPYLAGLLVLPTVACSSPPSSNPAPVQQPGVATGTAITAADLSRRLHIYAHDSMLGREAGTIGNVRATDYLAAEVRRLGLEPAGENGTYFQTVPLTVTRVDTASSRNVNDTALTIWTDYIPIQQFRDLGTTRSLDGVQAVYGGRYGDTAPVLAPEQITGKLVVFDAPLGRDSTPTYRFWAVPGLRAYASAAGVAFATLDITPPATRRLFRRPRTELGNLSEPGRTGPLGMIISARTVALLLGAPTESLTVGAPGRTLRGAFGFIRRPADAPARNVVAILRGSDLALRNQYVVIGAHNDHLGVSDDPVEHDSLRTFNQVIRPKGAESPTRPPTEDEVTRIRAILDSLRALRPARLDSVYNGADDDGSGSVALLEIAEAFAGAAERPRRSILFVWHTAEEKGLLGAEYFTDHPTVPRDSIVAQLNIDMIGRGKPDDHSDGGPGYVVLIGSRRLSTELGDLVETVNSDGGHGLSFDYQYDASGHPQRLYCRSDHYMYARYGIPIAFFSTGDHRDYHQLTDEPEYIDYDKLGRVSRLIHDIALHVVNLDHRLVVDQPKPDPHAECHQ